MSRKTKDGRVSEFIGTRVSKDLRDKLQEWAKDECRTMSNLVLKILSDAVKGDK